MLLPPTWLWAKVLQMRCGAMFFQGRNCASNSFPSTILCMVSGIWPSPGPKNHQNQRIGPYFCYRKVASRRSKTIPQVRAPKFRLRPTPSDRRNRQPGPGQTHKQKHASPKPNPLRHLAPRTPALAHEENDRPFAPPSLGYIYIYITCSQI